MSVDHLGEVTNANRWKAIARSVVIGEFVLPVSTADFATYWIVAGDRMREQIADDRLFSDLLRRTLPPYAGGAATLFRGENVDRWRAGALGFAWTPNVEVARMFGRGLNAICTGGILLRGTFASRSIISGPNEHSSYLQEEQFTIDPFLANDVQEIETYPAG
jgi:hypothetical protein